MSQRTFTVPLFVALVFVVLSAACSSSSSGNEERTSVDDVDGSDEVSDEVSLDISDADLFISDEGAGCGVYVSIDSRVAASVDPLTAIWEVLRAERFDTCPFSDPAEMGLITVDAVDEYEQPDWSTVEDHAYFEVRDWALVRDCIEDSDSAACGAPVLKLK